MPHWSQALQGVNKKCSAAVNVLHFKCPVRVNEIPAEVNWMDLPPPH